MKAFWSLTMYSVPDFYLVENPIDRYSIGDRTPGVILDDDGALTITISHERPTGDKEAANWLPSPAGDFRPVMRMYEPDAGDPRPDLRVPRHHALLTTPSHGGHTVAPPPTVRRVPAAAIRMVASARLSASASPRLADASGSAKVPSP